MGLSWTSDSFCQSMSSEDQSLRWHNVTAVGAPCSQRASSLTLCHQHASIPHSHIIWWVFSLYYMTLLCKVSWWLNPGIAGPPPAGTIPEKRLGGVWSVVYASFFTVHTPLLHSKIFCQEKDTCKRKEKNLGNPVMNYDFLKCSSFRGSTVMPICGKWTFYQSNAESAIPCLAAHLFSLSHRSKLGVHEFCPWL